MSKDERAEKSPDRHKCHYATKRYIEEFMSWYIKR